MTHMTKVAFLTSGCGDWIGMYIDGKLVTEGHSIPEREVAGLILGFLNIKHVEGSEFLEEYGNHCPATWDEVLQ